MQCLVKSRPSKAADETKQKADLLNMPIGVGRHICQIPTKKKLYEVIGNRLVGNL
jgi:hypothetical protein